jgi:ligand-binding sensor domain-containing protein/signal transduction histidine kinase
MNSDAYSFNAVLNFACTSLRLVAWPPYSLRRICDRAIVILFTLLVASHVHADSIQSLRFSHLTQEHGLPSSSVVSILQDTQGFMWLGTVNGLARYDGRQIKKFEFDDQNQASISNPLVTALFEDHDRVLWIGTRSGFDRLDLQTETIQRQVMPTALSLQNRQVSGIAVAPLGKLWVAMFGGLYQFDTRTRQFSAWQSDDTRLQGRVFAVVSDTRGGVWLGQGNQVAHIDQDGQLQQIFSTLALAPMSNSPVDYQVRSLALDAEQRLWVGMENGLQIWRIETATVKPDPLRQQFVLPSGLIRSIFRDSDNAIWIAQGGQSGISKWNNKSKKLERYVHSRAITSSLGAGVVQSLTQDSNGSLWVGTSDGGASQADLRSKRFSLYLNESVDQKNLTSPIVMAMSFVSEHVAWIGTYSDGLVSLNLDNGDVHKIPASQMPLTKIKSQFLSPDGKLWIGGDGGLFVFDPRLQRSQEINLKNRLAAGASISSMALDTAGNLWVGSAMGLYQIKQAVGRDVLANYEVTVYRTDSQQKGALGHDVVDSLLIDSVGRLWVGTKGGLYLWRPELSTFQSVVQASSVVVQPDKFAIAAIRQDRQNRIWLATELGLFDLSEKNGEWHLQAWSGAKNMPQGGFDSLHDALNGEIWLGSDLGLTRLLPEQNLARFYPALTHFGAGINFGASARGPDGSLYFGTKGLIRFKPEELTDNLLPPKVVLSDILLFNRSVQASHKIRHDDTKPIADSDNARQKASNRNDREWINLFGIGTKDSVDNTSLEELGITGALHLARKIRLTHKHTMVSFQLSALQYFNRSQNRYAWKLEGSDPDWIYGLEAQGTATYTNLNPGNYRLYAKAANPDGVWSDTTMLLEVEVLPPFWRTWWSYLSLLLLLLAIVIAVYRLRIRSFRANQIYLQNEVAARTGEAIEQREIAEQARKDIALLSEIGREIIASLDTTTIQQVLYQHVNRLIPAMSFGIGMVNWESRQIEFNFVMAHGRLVEVYQRSLDAIEQPTSKCVLSAREIKIDNYQFDSRDKDSINRGESDQWQVRLADGSEAQPARSGIFVPMIIKSKVIGVLGIQRDQVMAFSSHDLDILRTLAAYAAIAFDNAEAYQYLQMTQAKLVEQEKLAALGSLVAGVAHELNTPLGNSLLTASTMQEMSEKFLVEIETGKVRRSSLDVFARATETSAGLLVRNLSVASDLIVGFKQIAVDQVSDQRRQFNLKTVSEEVALTISNRLKREEHHLHIELPSTIFMDSFPGPYAQVLSNLVINAMVHAFDGRKHGEMWLKADLLNDKQVRLIFSDNGHGISEANLSRIFDPFFTTRLGQGGSGLGLHICYNIINSVLGGSVQVKSALGEGTSFEITLPLIAPERNQVVTT